MVLGLAQARSPWFREVARWANAGSLPVEFAKCQSPEELRARMATGRPVSAVLVDGTLAALDRDLSEAIAASGSALIVVADGPVRRDLAALGASAWLESTFGPVELLDFLVAFARPVRRAVDVPGDTGPEPVPLGTARLFAVCGPGGTGASTVAIALAEGLAGRTGRQAKGGAGGAAGAGSSLGRLSASIRTAAAGKPTPADLDLGVDLGVGVDLGRAATASRPTRIVLADLCRHADQAMLHDARQALDGVQELSEAHGTGRLSPEQTAALCFAVPERGYFLLAGLRRAKAWPAVKPRAFAAALNSLRAAFDVVVADVDSDLESEADCGSMDVEDRNVMNRTTVLAADAVLVVGRAGMKGVHALVRTIHEVAAAGVHPARIVPVVAAAPRPAPARAQLTSAMAELTALPGGRPAPPILLPDRRVDEALQDGVALPAPLPALVAAGVVAALAHQPTTLGLDEPGREPRRVRPGSLGVTWDDEDSEAWG